MNMPLIISSTSPFLSITLKEVKADGKQKSEDCLLEIQKSGRKIAIYQQVIVVDLDEAGREVELLEEWLVAEEELINF